MKVYIRKSAAKHRKKTGFLNLKKNRGGRAVVRNQRRVAAGGKRTSNIMRKRHVKRKDCVRAAKNR